MTYLKDALKVQNNIERIAPTKIGGSDTNCTEVETDGTLVAKGDATCFRDELGDVLSLQQSGSGVSNNVTENTTDFTTASNLSDYVYGNYQFNHDMLPGTVVFPHVHWFQAQNNVPNFLIQYRRQKQTGAAKTTAWTNYPMKTNAFAYTSGTINQITHDSGITPPVGYGGVSDILQVRLLRDNANTSTAFVGADPYTATVGILSVDIHIQVNMFGSHSEYTK